MSKAKHIRIGPITMLQGLLPFNPSTFSKEIIAGITLAAIAVPEVMGYTRISGTPVITGLYTILIPAFLYALFGSSRHLVVGADSATAAILASGLAAMSITDPAEYLALSGILALMSAALLIVARLFKMGFLAHFLSRSALIGFLTGVGIQVAMGEFAGIFGVHAEGGSAPAKLWYFLSHPALIHLPSLCLSLVALGVIIFCMRVSDKLPGPLIAVIGSMAAAGIFGFEALGIDLLGALPSGLPSIHLPDLSSLNADRITTMISLAISMFVVILAQSAATSRAYADRYNEKYDANVDLVGLAAANIGAGLSGTFVVNGSPTKTEILDSAGGRSQVAQLAAVGAVLVVLLFLTGPLAYLPNVVLSVIVFLIGLKLIDFQGMAQLYQQTRGEFWIATATAAIVVLVGVKEGILFALVASLLDHVKVSYRPRTYVLANGDKDQIDFKHVERVEALGNGVVVYCFTHSLYYANSLAFLSDVETIEARMGADMKVLCIQSAAISNIDFSAAQMLRSLIQRLQEKDVRVVFALTTPHVRKQMKRYGFSQILHRDDFISSMPQIKDLLEGGAK